ncbi:unnamed protein product [Rotaria magnacalcarata]|uniref:Uncharacterized protein n=1 Tax=Rotaria magnacalcarata TaxID=392030 RepID=A0A8S2KDI4_9BILA|nr:unnamed protein product [Rotaria magnacalcarata]
MTTRHHLNTDHWSKMRMNVIQNAINTEQRGRVLSWEKHKQTAAQHELEAAIRGTRSLPKNNVGPVHNFQDVLKHELDTYVPGSAYFRRQSGQSVDRINAKKNTMKNTIQVDELNLNDNRIAKISEQIRLCPRLKTLRIDRNNLALDAIPAGLLTDSNLSLLSFEGNRFDEKAFQGKEGYEQYMQRFTASRRKLE